MKMPLDTKVGLVPGITVLDGNTAISPWKGAQQPHFSADVCRGQTVVHISNC